MKVNTLNYETYFLLYIDNELSEQDRKEVELFLAQNSKYTETFEYLLHSVLAKEEIVFEHKELLFRLDQLEVLAPLDLKENLLRKESTIIEGNFNFRPWLRYSAIAASLFLVLTYGWYNANTKDKYIINNTELASANTKNKIAGKKAIPFKATIIEGVAKIHSKKEFNYPIPQHNDSQVMVESNQTKAPERIQAITLMEEPAEKNIVLSNSPAALTEATTLNTPTDKYNEISSNEQERTIYIANLEIDAEKFRGISRRINALLKITKTEKEK